MTGGPVVTMTGTDFKFRWRMINCAKEIAQERRIDVVANCISCGGICDILIGGHADNNLIVLLL